MGNSKPAPPSARALDDAMLRLQPLNSRELALHALAGIDALAEGVLGPKARREERMLERLEALEQRLLEERAAEQESALRLRCELERELAARVEEWNQAAAERAALKAQLRQQEDELKRLGEELAQLRVQLRTAAHSVGGLRERLLPAELRAQLEQWRKEAR
jgi:chromosome segregation ATPase